MARGYPDWQRAPAESALDRWPVEHLPAHGTGNTIRRTTIQAFGVGVFFRVIGRHVSAAFGLLASAVGAADVQVELELLSGVPADVGGDVLDAWSFDLVSPVSERTVYNLDLPQTTYPGPGLRSLVAGDDLYIRSATTGATNVSALDVAVRGIVFGNVG